MKLTYCSLLLTLALAPNAFTQTTILGARYACSYGLSGGVVVNAGTSIAAAIASLPTNGGTVDARCFDSSFSSSQLDIPNNVFNTSVTSQPVQLLLGAANYSVGATQILNSGSSIIGLGRGQGTELTSLSATFSSGPLLQMGVGSSSGVRIESMQLFCEANSASIGVENQNAQELSSVNNVLIQNCGIGLYVNGSGSQNSGPYNNLEIYPYSAAASTCITVSSIAIRGISGVSCVNASSPPLTKAISVASSTNIEDVHCEGVTSCIYVSADDVFIRNIDGPGSPSSVTNLVYIASATPSLRNISIFNLIQSQATNAIVDNTTTPATTISDPNTDLGFYLIGEVSGSGSNPGTRIGSALGSPNIVTLGNFTFAALPNPIPYVGSLVYCTNCTVGKPCTGSGSGALAIVEGTVWACR